MRWWKDIKRKIINSKPGIPELVEAINSVDEFYFQQADVILHGDQLIIDEQKRRYERRLLTEIYFQLKTKFLRRGTILYADVEVIKDYIFSINNDPEIERTLNYLRAVTRAFNNNDELRYITTIPDFLIHQSQDNIEEGKQKLIAELKTDPILGRKEFFKDLFKLNIYLEKYRFQVAAFIIVNKNFDFIRTQASNYYRNENLYKASMIRENLYFIFRRTEQGSFEALTLAQLLVL